MQLKLAFVTAALATLAVATPAPRDTCSTGFLECCDDIQPASDPTIATLLKIFDIVLQDVNVDVGTFCTPFTFAGISGSCMGELVCCKETNGTLAIGCVFADRV